MNEPRMIGILLIIVGALFLLVRAGLGEIWPLFIIVPGVAMLAIAVTGPTSAAGLAIPGSIVSTVGLILLIQASTGTFHTWSYAWGLVMAGVGAGSFLKGSLEGDEAEAKEGSRLAILGLAFFAGFGAFFELFVFGGFLAGMAGWVIPIALIAGGVWLLRRNR